MKVNFSGILSIPVHILGVNTVSRYTRQAQSRLVMKDSSYLLPHHELFNQERGIMRIILADHHVHALWGLKTMLEEGSGFTLVGEARDADTLIAVVRKLTPDLVLTDWELPGRSIEDTITILHSFKPKPIVVVMSSKPEYGGLFLRIGADAFVSKGDHPDWLIETLHKFNQQSRKETTE
jgi:AmiR/NasT family two-component response regulator